MAVDYGCTPLTAWDELGCAPALGRRGRRRVTRAAQELASYDLALREVTKKGRDLEKDPPDVAHVLMAREMTDLYKRRMGWEQFDNNTDGFTPDDPQPDA